MNLNNKNTSRKQEALKLARDIKNITSEINQTLIKNRIDKRVESQHTYISITQAFTGEYRDPLNETDSSNSEEEKEEIEGETDEKLGNKVTIRLRPPYFNLPTATSRVGKTLPVIPEKNQNAIEQIKKNLPTEVKEELASEFFAKK